MREKKLTSIFWGGVQEKGGVTYAHFFVVWHSCSRMPKRRGRVDEGGLQKSALCWHGLLIPCVLNFWGRRPLLRSVSSLSLWSDYATCVCVCALALLWNPSGSMAT